MPTTIPNRAANGNGVALKVRVTLPRLRTVPSSLMATDSLRIHQLILNNQLLLASGKGDGFEVDRRLNDGADPDAVDLDLNTSLHHLSVRGLTRIAERLLDAWRATINMRNRMGFAPLDLCSASGKISTVKMLLARYPRTEALGAEFVRAAKMAEEYREPEIAGVLRRAAGEGIGFLSVGDQAPARTVS